MSVAKAGSASRLSRRATDADKSCGHKIAERDPSRIAMAAANRNAATTEKVAQHPASGERIFQMQFVDPPHDCEASGDTGRGL
ncbi:hypothetical protein GGD83_002319 [Rhodoblastus sphagnicola]|nr:hypothetical protein [Rhodoblastus sphagnicola]